MCLGDAWVQQHECSGSKVTEYLQLRSCLARVDRGLKTSLYVQVGLDQFVDLRESIRSSLTASSTMLETQVAEMNVEEFWNLSSSHNS